VSCQIDMGFLQIDMKKPYEQNGFKYDYGTKFDDCLVIAIISQLRRLPIFRVDGTTPVAKIRSATQSPYFKYLMYLRSRYEPILLDLRP